MSFRSLAGGGRANIVLDTHKKAKPDDIQADFYDLMPGEVGTQEEPFLDQYGAFGDDTNDTDAASLREEKFEHGQNMLLALLKANIQKENDPPIVVINK